ncbi:hypothetical protein FQR65_LT06548 [Abscondita terminalis]|nr:hypothetical protein FQR65_LT06548 [Abscondita terminalis]
MDTLQTSPEPVENISAENSVDIDLNKLITPDQLYNNAVARKRRNLSKKCANRPREPTPGREVLNANTDDEAEKRPKTPERRRRKTSESFRFHAEDKQSDVIKKRDSLVSSTHAEVLALFDKAKRSLTKKKEIRSQSVPSQFELDLNIVQPLIPQSESTEKPQTKHDTPIRPKSFEKKKRHTTPKIIEVLDPKTSKVIKKISKGVTEVPVTLLGLVTLPRYLSVKEIFVLYRVFKREKRHEWQKISRLRNRCVTNLMLIIIMCGLGGIMFKYIEGAFENFYKCGVKRVKRDFINTLWYHSHSMREDEWKSLARNKLRIFEEELHVAHEAGMHSYSGQRSWSFLNGVIYCLTVISTIGYGHIVPTTNTGMALSIVYAIIGIPLFLIALTDFGKLFTRGIKFVWSFVRRVYYTGSCRKVRKTAHVQDILQGAQMVYDIARLRKPSMFSAQPDDPENPKSQDTVTSTGPTTPALSNFEIDDEFNLPISVAIFILVLYIFLGAVMYCIWEQWNFFASFYFVFISMSTIGFGDYVPRDPYCMMVSVIYLVFGLALMSMCINVVQVKLSDTFSGASAKLGATIGLNVNEEDGSIDTVTPPPVEVPSVHNGTKDDEEEVKKVRIDVTKKEKKPTPKPRCPEPTEKELDEIDSKLRSIMSSNE